MLLMVNWLEAEMASLRKSFQTYIGFPQFGDDRHHNSAKSGDGSDEFGDEIKVDRKSEGVDKSEEECVDLWNLCEPAKNPFESLLRSPGSSTRHYGSSVQMSPSSAENLCSGKSDGLQFCTESLGFESSDEREDCHAHFSSTAVISAEEKQEEESDTNLCSEAAEKRPYAPGHGHMGTNKGARFPPPLPSLAGNGKASVFLKPLRKDGRFLLQEVEIPRQELFHAWRQDGRLRLQLIPRSDSPPPDTSDDSLHRTDTSSVYGWSDGTAAETALTSSSSGDGGQRGASLEDELVHAECFRRGGGADAPLPILSFARCQEMTACLPTWKPRYVAT